MSGHRINIGVDQVSAMRAINAAMRELRVISEEQLVAALEQWCIENGECNISPKHLAARLLAISEELEAKSST